MVTYQNHTHSEYLATITYLNPADCWILTTILFSNYYDLSQNGSDSLSICYWWYMILYKLLGISCYIGMSKLVTYWLWNMAGDPAEQIQILFDKIYLERHLYKTAIEYDKIMPQ